MMILEADRLSITFGGVRAIDGVSIAIESGQVFSIIGPNGSGKTTLFNLVSGIYTPNDGSIRFAGEMVTGLPPDQLARRGLSRTFQNLQIFSRMSVLENAMVGRHRHERTGILADLLHLPSVARQNEATREAAHDGACPRRPCRCRQTSGWFARIWRPQAPRNRARSGQRSQAAAARRAGRRLQSCRNPGNRSRDPLYRKGRNHGRVGRARYASGDEYLRPCSRSGKRPNAHRRHSRTSAVQYRR